MEYEWKRTRAGPRGRAGFCWLIAAMVVACEPGSILEGDALVDLEPGDAVAEAPGAGDTIADSNGEPSPGRGDPGSGGVADADGTGPAGDPGPGNPGDSESDAPGDPGVNDGDPTSSPGDAEPANPGTCVGGEDNGFPCSGLHLRSRLSLADLSANTGNDIWGWVDPQTGAPYALMGLNNGTAFVDLSDPSAPGLVGTLPTATQNSDWRDIKVVNNTAYIVSEAPGHGLQVFDLARLRDAGPDDVFDADTVYDGFGHSHNVVANEDSAFVYAVGSNTCSGGLHMVDVSAPLDPQFAGCHSVDGYTHDAQCVMYAGPDTEHLAKEICINSNENFLVIVDVTDKNATETLANFSFNDFSYVHQNWLTEDHRFLFVGDEADEADFGYNTRTLVFDVSDLDNPVFLYDYIADTTSIDHNLYIVENRIYQANYNAGLRVLKFEDPSTNTLVEEAFFDTFPENDRARFNGAWSVYPFFPDGLLIVSDIDRGLFVLSE